MLIGPFKGGISYAVMSIHAAFHMGPNWPSWPNWGPFILGMLLGYSYHLLEPPNASHTTYNTCPIGSTWFGTRREVNRREGQMRECYGKIMVIAQRDGE